MAYTFQFRDVFAQRDAIVDGLVLTLELTVGIIVLGFVIGAMLQALSPETVKPLDASLSVPLVPGLSAIAGVNPGVYRWQQLETRSKLGLIGEARSATPEKGERLLDAIAHDVADALSNQALWNAPI